MFWLLLCALAQGEEPFSAEDPDTVEEAQAQLDRLGQDAEVMVLSEAHRAMRPAQATLGSGQR